MSNAAKQPMKLINTRAGLIWGPAISTKGLPVGVLDGQAAKVQWLPGENDLDPDYWAKVKDVPGVKRLLAAGKIRVEPGKAIPLARHKPTPRSGAPEQKEPRHYGDKPPAYAPTRNRDLVLPASPPATLAHLAPAMAVAVIGRETDTERLSTWFEQETREVVLEALTQRGMILTGSEG